MTLSQIRWQSRCVLTMPSPQWFALCHHKHFKTCIVTQVLSQSARDNRAPEARATPTTPFTLNKPHAQASRVMRWEGWDGRDNLWANHTSTYGKGPQASLNLSVKLAALFPHWNVRALHVPAERLKLAYATSDILGFALNVFPFRWALRLSKWELPRAKPSKLLPITSEHDIAPSSCPLRAAPGCAVACRWDFRGLSYFDYEKEMISL